ncbi:SDR family oxidoreductase [Occultella glacieicola]|uniref:SDR family oxidoreductase n=1 Tax=Occultella glacieicola TaxID=2518684 RepID=A0ABY2E235_9MICO|nr:SDR family NAD(P)-dependent oxidoreductase [Occultella glacieicola]TDE92664.1 SDR family oxidoreductase [Occultella glacieicola]
MATPTAISDPRPARTGPSSGPLAGRVVLVTGAAKGLGRSVALAAAAAGADVAFTFHTSDERAEKTSTEIQALGRRSLVRRCDVRDREQIARVVAATHEAFGRIDGLVNNAGIMPENAFLEITEEQWDTVIRTDLTSMFLTSQAVLPIMLEQGSGSIVNVASRLGQVGWPGVAHYAAAKAGVMALAKSISREFGQRGVRANAVAPGVINTDMGRTVMDGEVGRKRMAELPLGRFAEPEEVADAVIFLLSDASALFLGQTLGPNSGGLMP